MESGQNSTAQVPLSPQLPSSTQLDQPAPHDSTSSTSPLPTPTPHDESRANSTTPIATAYSQTNYAPSHDGDGNGSSDHQLGHDRKSSMSTGTPDRVFPIRSVVSVDESRPTPWVLSRSPSHIDYNPHQETTWDGSRRPSSVRLVTDRSDTMPMSNSSSSEDRDPASRRSRHIVNPPPANATSTLFHDDASDTSDRTSIGEHRSLTNGGGSQMGDLIDCTSPESNMGLMTTRFRHVKTENGHAIITGRDGTLQRCEDEPIHTPGAIQAFGLLVALKEEADGRLSPRIVSENSKQMIGYSPHELFKLGSFTEIFSEEQADNLLDHIDFIRDEESDPSLDGPDVFSISLRPPNRKQIKLWCAIHVNESHPDLIICEFEPEDDQQYPIRPPEEATDSDEPEDTLYQNPTAEELSESTQISSKPLRVLRSARRTRGESGAMQVFDIMSQVQGQLASAPNLEQFLKILVGIVKELTGFHRVMIYQFDAAFNGKVVTELVDPGKTRDLYHGLHFPATDIPKQARDLYKLNKVRLLYDRDLESARLVCRTDEDLERPLNLSHAYLRAMSPIHLKYLANMAVRSSMSISINAFNELWGLIACHSYGPSGMRVSFPIRKMCRLVGDTASRNIERLSYASRLHARKLINTMPTGKNPSGYIVASSEDLLKLFDADFGMLCIRDETKVLGKIEQSQEALAMLEYLRLRNFTSVLTTQDIRQDFPDLRYKPGFSVIAGLLYVPLSLAGHDFIVFFRKGQAREVKWAGNPYDKVIKEGTANLLEPRSSFKLWRETVMGKCRDWSEEQVETAAVLCLVYGKFIEVWRQKEAALRSSRLHRLLLANSAHEVRTPLNAIINYLEIALEGTLEPETRDNLARSHSASKSLIYVINDLLDLTKTEEGQELIKDEIVDLSACIVEATEVFKDDAKRKGISYEVNQHPGLPRYVLGDYRRVRQAMTNVIANAMENTTHGSVKVECFVAEVLGSRVRIEIVVRDTGCGMSSEKLDNLFQELEQVSSSDLGESEALEMSMGESNGDGRTLGLGLAIVSRIVRNMDGQLRLTSEEGKGSKFVIQFPFELPTGETLEEVGASNATVSSKLDTITSASVTKSLPPTEKKEVLLVDRGSGSTPNPSNRSMTETRSFDETNSMNSLTSGASGGARSNKSDADRLIDAIQNPVFTEELDAETTSLERKISKHRLYPNTSATTSAPSLDISQQAATLTSTPEKPSLLHRPSTGPIHMPESQPGMHFVRGSVTPIKAVKILDEYFDQPAEPQSSRILFEIPENSAQGKNAPKPSALAHTRPNKLRVLIAEDDPVNMKILSKRLEKAGHEVTPALNGEQCAIIYRQKSSEFDIILMDMQMPIVDGLTSTKLIRAFEKSGDCPGLSTLARSHGRIPIFAVSASLVEKDRLNYTETGFDGWILKPIDFKRLRVVLEGITDDDVREQCLYEPGAWERGGWFDRRATKPLDALITGKPETDDIS